MIGRLKGVFAMKNTANMPCLPHDIDPNRIMGSMDDPAQARVAERIVIFARISNSWVGVSKRKFLVDKHSEREARIGFRDAVEWMIEIGLLEITDQKKGFGSWTNFFRKKIICPTPILIARILKHQQAISYGKCPKCNVYLRKVGMGIACPKCGT